MTQSGLLEQKRKLSFLKTHPLSPGTPFRGRYFIKNLFFNICMRFLDVMLAGLFSFKKRNVLPLPPLRNVLLVNPAHLGDVVMSTTVLPILKKSVPHIQVGFLCSSWSQEVLKDHPLIDRIHCVDHWKLNRSDSTRWQKIKRHLITTVRTLKELKKIKYDAVFVLYPYYPNFIPLVILAGIPIRAGYETAGFGPLLTHMGVWDKKTTHLAEHQANLLNIFTLHPLRNWQSRIAQLKSGGESRFSPRTPHRDNFSVKRREVIGEESSREGALQYSLPGDPSESEHRIRKFGLLSQSYIIMHMGSGSSIKEWPLEKWRSLVQRLNRMSHTLVFTGQSQREKKNVDCVINGATNCVNMCVPLEWNDFSSIIQQAKLVISVDTLTAHLASAFQRPYVVLMSGLVNPQLIRPLGGRGSVLSIPLPCSPCYRKQGCSTMDCIRDIEVEEVYQAAQRLLHHVSYISNN